MKITDLKFRYNKTDTGRPPILDIGHLQISETGCHAVLGPNGCGKTTLLKLIAGLLVPDSGVIDGKDGAVLVHQNPYLLSGTVYHNVAYGLKIRRIHGEEIRRRVLTELDRWGLGHLKDRHSSRLSGGEKQRTAIARAMILRPGILLLDEPTSSVDPEKIGQMEKLIAEVVETDTTVIMSTHNMEFAYRVADTITRMMDGKQVGSEENVISGEVFRRDEFFNHFRTGNTVLYSPGHDGNFSKAVFSFNDVILSRNNISSSARNILETEVIDINTENGYCIIGLDAGFRFRARISTASLQLLDLKTGRQDLLAAQVLGNQALLAGGFSDTRESFS